MKKNKILIVDDMLDNIKVLQAILSDKSKYETHYALSGKDAIMLCSKHKYDLILLDIIMPEIDGYEVCQYLKSREETKDIPVTLWKFRMKLLAGLKKLAYELQKYSLAIILL